MNTEQGFIRLFCRGVALIKHGRLSEAQDTFRLLLEADPTNAEIYYHLGITFHGVAQWENAANAYRQAIALDPAHLDALKTLGRCLMELGDGDGAMEAFESATIADPGCGDAWCAWASLLLERAKACASVDSEVAFESEMQGIECLYKALEVSPHHFNSRCRLINYLFDEKAYEEAERHVWCLLERLTDMDRGQRSDAWYLLGQLHYLRDEFEPAARAFQEACDLDPSCAYSFYYLGICGAMTHQVEIAVSAYERCVSLDPTNDCAWETLGELYRYESRHEDAERCFREAKSLKPISETAE